MIKLKFTKKKFWLDCCLDSWRMILIITGIVKKLNLKNIQYQFKKDPFLQKYVILLKIKLSKKDTFFMCTNCGKVIWTYHVHQC